MTETEAEDAETERQRAALERRERKQAADAGEIRLLRLERLRILAATRGPWALQLADVVAVQWALDHIAELEAR